MTLIKNKIADVEKAGLLRYTSSSSDNLEDIALSDGLQHFLQIDLQLDDEEIIQYTTTTKTKRTRQIAAVLLLCVVAFVLTLGVLSCPRLFNTNTIPTEDDHDGLSAVASTKNRMFQVLPLDDRHRQLAEKEEFMTCLRRSGSALVDEESSASLRKDCRIQGMMRKEDASILFQQFHPSWPFDDSQDGIGKDESESVQEVVLHCNGKTSTISLLDISKSVPTETKEYLAYPEYLVVSEQEHTRVPSGRKSTVHKSNDKNKNEENNNINNNNCRSQMFKLGIYCFNDDDRPCMILASSSDNETTDRATTTRFKNACLGTSPVMELCPSNDGSMAALIDTI